jgi:hypothetical protein
VKRFVQHFDYGRWQHLACGSNLSPCEEQIATGVSIRRVLAYSRRAKTQSVTCFISMEVHLSKKMPMAASRVLIKHFEPACLSRNHASN